jgi:hypothetical protein
MKRARTFRLAMMLALFILLAFAAPAEAVHTGYENVRAALNKAAAAAIPLRLSVAIELIVLPQAPALPGTDPLFTEEKARVEALAASVPGLVLVHVSDLSAMTSAALGLGSGTVVAQGSASGIRAETAGDEGAFAAFPQAGRILIVRLVSYRSGPRDLYETTARLVDPKDRRELARDVAWTSRFAGRTLALFVNGWRLE